MDLGLQIPDSADSSGAFKRRAVGATDADSSSLGTNTAKLTLNLAQRVRILESALFSIFLIPVDNVFISAMNKAGQAYHNAVTEDKTKRATLGDPHLHVWNALLTCALVEFPNTAETITTYLNAYKNGAVDLGKEVRVFKITKTHNKTVRKLIVYFYPGSDSHTLFFAIAHLICSKFPTIDARVGTAPPGNLERIIQGQIEK